MTELNSKEILAIGGALVGATVSICMFAREAIKQHSRAIEAEKKCILLEGLVELGAIVIDNQNKKIEEQ